MRSVGKMSASFTIRPRKQTAVVRGERAALLAVRQLESCRRPHPPFHSIPVTVLCFRQLFSGGLSELKARLSVFGASYAVLRLQLAAGDSDGGMVLATPVPRLTGVGS